MSQGRITPKPLNYSQKEILRRRGLDPKDFLLLKDTYSSLYILDRRNGRVKIITKLN